MKKILFIVLALFLLISLAVSGCTQTQAPAGSSTPTTSSSLNPGEFKPTSTGTSTAGGNGVLNLSNVDPITLDPAVVGETTSVGYIFQIYSGLLRIDDNMQLQPDIATAMPAVSSDGTTYTFKLKQNVKFQDGTQVTANDFKYSWERAANPATKSQTAGTYLGDIVGVKDMLAGKSTSISGVKVLDNYTLQVTIDSPKSYFLYRMAYPTSFVVEKSNVQSGANWWQKPIGTGPFKLQQWTPNQSLTLVRNDNYYGNLPQLAKVNYQYYTGNPMDLYETGKIDTTGISLDYIDEVMDKSGPYYQELTTSSSLDFGYIGFNNNQPPFDDVNIRKAFSMAIDKDKIISLVYRGMVQKADGILPPGMPGYNQNLVGLGFNPDQAKNLIKSSKYGDVSNLPPIILTTSGYGGLISQYLQALVYQWKQNLGVDVQIRQLEPDRYFYVLNTETDQMFDTGWIADYPHPQDFIDVLFRSGGDSNYGNYSNAQVDSLIQQADQNLNQSQSLALYQQAEQLIVNDAAVLPLYFGKNYYLTRPYVHGYTVNPLGIVNLAEVSISPH